MHFTKQANHGASLVEILLILIIGAGLVVIGIRQYQNFRLDADMQQLKYNIDTVFQAAAGYYYANCSQGRSLDPIIATDSTKAIDISSDLIGAGYLSAFPNSNPLVNEESSNHGYSVQFNKYTVPKMQTVCSDPPDCLLSTSVQVGTVVLWKIQVSVTMYSSRLTTVQHYLQADSVSENNLIFERMPSYATSDWTSQSTFWVSNPLVKQFKEMYTTNPITDLTNQDHTTEYQYYYCSG